MFECGFIYVAGGLDPETCRAVIPSENINMNVIGCADYAQAEAAAVELVNKGCDAIELMMAGASAVQIGAAIFTDPFAPVKIIDEMNEFLDSKGIKSVKDIIGTVKPW